MAIVVFDPTDFKLAYPEFATASDVRCSAMFTIAEQGILDNTDDSPVCPADYRAQLFYLLVAHLLTIFGANPATSASPNTPPGRLSSATEGSVTAAFEYLMPQGSAMAAWYTQTKYGALYWMMTAQFRSARYYAIGSSGVGFSKAFGVSNIYAVFPQFGNCE